MEISGDETEAHQMPQHFKYRVNVVNSGCSWKAEALSPLEVSSWKQDGCEVDYKCVIGLSGTVAQWINYMICSGINGSISLLWQRNKQQTFFAGLSFGKGNTEFNYPDTLAKSNNESNLLKALSFLSLIFIDTHPRL